MIRKMINYQPEPDIPFPDIPDEPEDPDDGELILKLNNIT